MNLTPRARALVATLITLAVGVLGAGVGIIVTTDDGHGGQRAVTVRLSPPKVATTPQGDLNTEGPLKAPPPAPSTVRRNKPNERNLLERHAPAGAQTYTCKQAFGGHLYSSRGGIRPTEFVIHYTAGNGTAESIDAYFRRTRAASATDILEPSGHCLQEVPLSEKPWTQLAANPYAISVEIVTTGYNVTRAQWLAMPIFTKGILAALMRDQMRAYGIPLRRVDPIGCNFVPGYTDHNALECGNDHTDVLPNFPWDVLARQLHDSGAAPLAISKTARAKCTELNRIRRHTADYHRRYHLKPVPPNSRADRARADELRASLKRGRYRCKVGAPGKRGTITRR